MMSKYERMIVRLTTAIFLGFSLFVFVGLIFWLYPRQVVISASQMQTDRAVYSIGDSITVTGVTWTNVDSKAEFDVRLICNDVKYNYYQIINFQVSRQNMPVKYSFPYPEIPVYIPQGNCRIETTANYSVQILPLLTRNYQYRFNSNEFRVI